MTETIPRFDGSNLVEWARSFNDVLQITWPFPRKIVSGLERPEPISREYREGEKNTSNFDHSGSNPSKLSAHGWRNPDKEPLTVVTTLRPGTQQMSIYLVS